MPDQTRVRYLRITALLWAALLAPALARALRAAADDPAAARNEALTLRERVQAQFSADAMTDAVLAAYMEARKFLTARAS